MDMLCCCGLRAALRVVLCLRCECVAWCVEVSGVVRCELWFCFRLGGCCDCFVGFCVGFRNMIVNVDAKG